MSAVREGPETKLTVRGMARRAEAGADLLPRALVAADQVLVLDHDDVVSGRKLMRHRIVGARRQHQRARLGDGGGRVAEAHLVVARGRGRACAPAPARSSTAAPSR